MNIGYYLIDVLVVALVACVLRGYGDHRPGRTMKETEEQFVARLAREDRRFIWRVAIVAMVVIGFMLALALCTRLIPFAG